LPFARRGMKNQLWPPCQASILSSVYALPEFHYSATGTSSVLAHPIARQQQSDRIIFLTCSTFVGASQSLINLRLVELLHRARCKEQPTNVSSKTSIKIWSWNIIGAIGNACLRNTNRCSLSPPVMHSPPSSLSRPGFPPTKWEALPGRDAFWLSRHGCQSPGRKISRCTRHHPCVRFARARGL
jgi:hypothetical protein